MESKGGIDMGDPRPGLKFPAKCLAAQGRFLVFEAAEEDVAYHKPGVTYVEESTPVLPSSSDIAGAGPSSASEGPAPGTPLPGQ